MDARAASATEARTGMPLGARMFVLSAFLVLLALGAAVAVTLWVGLRIAGEQVTASLLQTSEAQTRLTERRLRELELTSDLIGADPALASYVASALGDDLGLGAAEGPDTASIRDLLLERQAQFGFHLGMVLDVDAQLVARTDQIEPFAMDMGDDAMVAAALARLAPVSGFWRFQDGLYQAAVMPLARDGALIGFLLVAGEVDDALCREIAAASGSDVAIWLPGQKGPDLVASSLTASRAARLQEAVAAQPRLLDALQQGLAVERRDIELDDAVWLLRATPTVPEAAEFGVLAALASRDAAAAGYREILTLLVIAGAGSLLLALPISLGLSRRVLKPVRTLVEAAERAAEGDYGTRVDAPGHDEIARLGAALDSLLSDLREKSDMERYVATFVRFGAETRAQPAAPSQRLREARAFQGLLLGIECFPEGEGVDAFAHASRVGRALGQLVDQCEGQLLAGDGGRFLLGFSGDDAVARALAAARSVLAAAHLCGRPALALAEGGAGIGDLQARRVRLTGAVGAAVLLVHRLLAETPPGRVLLAPNLVGRIERRYGTDAVERVPGVLGGQPRRALAPTLLAMTEPAGAAAMPMDEETGTAATTPTLALSADVEGGMEELPADSCVGGRFQILETLGAGGMGVVYKARDLELDEVVALKMLLPRALGDRENLDRLKDEIRLARRITHPNVLRTFDFGEAEGQPYISMEYVRGMTLRTLLQQSGRVPHAVALRIARQLCAGLAAAHAEGVLHRDLKPENVMVEAGGNAKLMDFGIARPVRRVEAGHTSPGTYIGTPAYSSPEQLAGEEVDERADVFAAGVLLYELFCGERPFHGRNPMELYMAQMQGEPRPPSVLSPSLPASLDTALLRCLKRDPVERFQSAGALAAALAELRA